MNSQIPSIPRASTLRSASLVLAGLLALGLWAGAAGAADDPRVPESNVEEVGVVKKTEPAPKTAEKIDPCAADDETFCFLNDRFRVRVEWLNFSSETGTGHVVDQPVSDNSGVFWFFDDGNWEMLVKVLDGCDINDRFWVFSAATTNVEYTLTVTDTQSGAEVSYTNPLGNAAAALTDTQALAVCL